MTDLMLLWYAQALMWASRKLGDAGARVVRKVSQRHKVQPGG